MEQKINKCRAMSDGNSKKNGGNGQKRCWSRWCWDIAVTVVVKECLTTGDNEQSPGSEVGLVIT